MKRLVLLALAFAACDGGAHPAAADLAELPDLAPPHLTAGATDGTVHLQGSDITIAGSSAGGVVGAFNITHGAGTVELNGRTVNAAVYERQMFPDLLLYQTLAVETDRIWIMWFYCSTKDNTLSTVFYESTDGTQVTEETATGTCNDLNTTSTITMQFPAIDLPEPALLDGYTISGADITLNGAEPGSVTFGASTLTLLVFNTVDCTTTCGTPGWTELHSLLWDKVAGRVCFGIVYLRSEDTTHVQIAYSLTLPTLTDPAGNVTLPATWTRP